MSRLQFAHNVRGRLLLVFLVPLVYLIVTLLSLSDYGVNWDEPKHMIRGQSYLHFILTGKKDFLDLPPYPQPKGAPDFVDYNVEPTKDTRSGEVLEKYGVRRSYFQSDFYTFDYFLTRHIHTHPEVNDLLSAFSNFIFYQKLGVLGDIEAYHLFVSISVFSLITAVALWTRSRFGIFASLIASSSLALYPLVFSESHFNFKDPPLMAFFGLTILTFWLGFMKKKAKHIVLSALFAGLALGTKFNAVFIPLVLGPWVLFVIRTRWVKRKNVWGIFGGRKVCLSLLLYPFIALAVVYVFSPYLWQDPVNRFIAIINYYKEVGSGTPVEVSYLFHGWNLYPLIQISYITPLPILLMALVGFVYFLFSVFRKKDQTSLLILLWLIVPISRAIWPNMNILSDVRHIMEFVPALAIMAGVGIFVIMKSIKNCFPKNRWALNVAISLITLSYLVIVLELIHIHPNENVYYNQLVGGLSGAYSKNLPIWGNTYGNVYLQGINWLNKNAEPNAKVALGWNYISSIPRLKLRKDIALDNAYWSGPQHKGEYLMEMHYNNPLQQRYKYAYFEAFLNPVYEVKVDGIPLLKIWKNSSEYIKPVYGKEAIIKPELVLTEDIQISPGVFQKRLKIQFTKEVHLAKLMIDHSSNKCEAQNGVGYVDISPDGKSWIRDQTPLIDTESPYLTPDMNEIKFIFMFPAKLARGILLNSEKANPCILKDYKVTIWGLEI